MCFQKKFPDFLLKIEGLGGILSGILACRMTQNPHNLGKISGKKGGWLDQLKKKEAFLIYFFTRLCIFLFLSLLTRRNPNIKPIKLNTASYRLV